MKEIKYLNRIADKTLDLRLEAFGAVQIAEILSGVAKQLQQSVGREASLRCRTLTDGQDIWLQHKQSHHYCSRVQHHGLLMNGRSPQ